MLTLQYVLFKIKKTNCISMAGLLQLVYKERELRTVISNSDSLVTRRNYRDIIYLSVSTLTYRIIGFYSNHLIHYYFRVSTVSCINSVENNIKTTN